MSPRARATSKATKLSRESTSTGIRCPKRETRSLGYLFEYGCALFWEFLYAWWIYLRRGFHVIQGCNPPDTIFLVALPFKLLGVKYIFDHHDANARSYIFASTARREFFTRFRFGWRS